MAVDPVARLVQRKQADALKARQRFHALVSAAPGLRAKTWSVRCAIETHGAALATFSAKDRNNIVRAGLQEIAEYWIAFYLELRFQDAYARRLGYHVSDRYEMWKAVQMGFAPRFDALRVPTADGGSLPATWDPEKGSLVWDFERLKRIWWDGVRAGRRKGTRSDWQEFLIDFKRNVRQAWNRARRDALAEAKSSGALAPLVFTGAMRAHMMAHARVVARATRSNAHAEIRLPSPTADGFAYGNSRNVRQVLNQLPLSEVQTLARRLEKTIHRMLTASGAARTDQRRQERIIRQREVAARRRDRSYDRRIQASERNEGRSLRAPKNVRNSAGVASPRGAPIRI